MSGNKWAEKNWDRLCERELYKWELSLIEVNWIHFQIGELYARLQLKSPMFYETCGKQEKICDQKKTITKLINLSSIIQRE